MTTTMDFGKQLMIGGQALVKLGSTRSTEDVDYLVFAKNETRPFIHDVAENTDYCNANGEGKAGKFFAEIWKMEENNIGELASPQALLELKAFSFVQHCLQGHWKKADAAEFDIKFIVREFGVSAIKIANKYISSGELSEVVKIINSVRK